MAKEEADLFEGMDSDESSILLDDFQEDDEFDEDLDEGSIGDLDYDEGDDFGLQPPKESPSQARPDEKLAPPREKSPGGNREKHSRNILILLLLLLGGSLFFFMNDFSETAFMEAFAEEPFTDSDEEISPIIVPDFADTESSEEILNLPDAENDFIVVEREPEKPSNASRGWMVQVAVCSFNSCVEAVSNRLLELGYSVSQKSTKRGYPLIQVISKLSFTEERINAMNRILNNTPQKIFHASNVRSGSKYRLLLGQFTTLENAKRARKFVETEVFGNQIQFNMNRVYRSTNKFKMLAGPYATRNEGLQAVRDLQDFTEFNDAFLVRAKG